MDTQRDARPMQAPWPGPVQDFAGLFPRPGDEAWQEQYAYSLGLQAYVWGFPWIYLAQLRWLWTSQAGKALAEKQGLSIPWAPLNSFFHAPQLAGPDNATGGSPNHDTLYSVAWLDLSAEPIVVFVPAVTDRFYCMQMACIDSDNFTYLGSRATGTEAANYLIAGPGWQGKVPADVRDALARARCPAVLIFGRTGVNDSSQAELDKAHAIQQGYRLTPLSRWGHPHRPPEPPPHAELPVGIDYNDTRGAWLTMNRAMTENPPGVPPGIDQSELIRLFATIGIGPGQRLEAQSDATLRGLQRAAADGLALLKQMTIARGVTRNNWIYPPRSVGRAGQAGDYITRAAIQALAGIADHDPIEAVYINTAKDQDGNALVATGQYAFTFDPAGDGFPPFDPTFHGFWSVTMYDMASYNLVAGSAAYTVNSYYPDYQARAADGSLTIVMQRDQPSSPPPGSYWLQTPPATDASGNPCSFYLILRVYVPGPTVHTTQSWNPPKIRRLA